ncbi:hypothetical protein GCM10010466_39440 [Planomonospora alba]|uniref:Uncharacterized protein n=1 Tax=Planomonospora alba TaxID=161354 RepID=A0ABP6ND89_9ACTN
MARRPRRWAPKGKGWRCVLDGGTTAVWMRLEADDTVTATVYLDFSQGQAEPDPYDGIWSVSTYRGGPILHAIMDKPYKIVPYTFRWAGVDTFWGTPSGYEPLPRHGVPRRSPKIRRDWTRYKHVHTRWYQRPMPGGYGIREVLPRKFRDPRGACCR